MKWLSSPAFRIADEVTIFGAITDRRLGAIRLALATAALMAIYIDPAEPDRYVPATYFSLVAYTLYSLFLYIYARKHSNFSWNQLQLVTWTDVAWYSVLISLSSGTNSVFFFFYTFAVIVASSRGGRNLGLAVTVVSTVSFLFVGWETTPNDQFELNRFLVRPLGLLAMGYVMAYWGGAELSLKKRLTLLKELSLGGNPRFGVDRTVEQMLRRILSFYDGESCTLLLAIDDGLNLYRVKRIEPDGTCRPVRLDRQLPQLPLSEPCAVVYTERTRWRNQPYYKAYDAYAHSGIDYNLDEGRAAAEHLGVRSFISAPLRYRERNRGRIIVGSDRSLVYSLEDAAFLLQVANQILPVVENIRLVDRMASDASEDERRRIARTVHDRVIQPYFGLRMGLQALHDILQPELRGGNGSNQQQKDKPAVLLEQLMTMTSDGIEELRQYVDGLKNAQSGDYGLVDAIRRFAHKFEGATGIQVDVVDESKALAINDRLTAEVFQMTSEALSNVRRHTRARSAQVRLDMSGDTLVLQVENETGEDVPHPTFVPASISERAEALGGRTDISWNDGRTVVRVEVPL